LGNLSKTCTGHCIEKMMIFGGEILKLMLNADDILLYVSDPGRSIPCFLRTIYAFSFLG